MARGWESKSVESQQDAAKEPPTQQKSRTAIEQKAKRQSLLLSRTRVSRELSETSSDLRRTTLQAALDFLNQELASLGNEDES